MPYHTNPTTGESGLCRATKSCPFGGADDHHESLDAARQAYEAKMGSGLITREQYVKAATLAYEYLADLRDGAETFEGTAYELHRKLARAEGDLVDVAHGAAEASEGQAREAWRRTVDLAAYRQAAHERVALEFMPREERGSREEHRARREEAEAKEQFAQARFEAGELYRYSDPLPVDHAQMMYESSGVEGQNKKFFALPEATQLTRVDEARRDLDAAAATLGNVDLAALRILRNEEPGVAYSALSDKTKTYYRRRAEAAVATLSTKN